MKTCLRPQFAQPACVWHKCWKGVQSAWKARILDDTCVSKTKLSTLTNFKSHHSDLISTSSCPGIVIKKSQDICYSNRLDSPRVGPECKGTYQQKESFSLSLTLEVVRFQIKKLIAEKDQGTRVPRWVEAGTSSSQGELRLWKQKIVAC